MSVDWKQHHANEAEKALEFEPVRLKMEEFARNMGFALDGLPEFGLLEIASYAAQAARARALGFDPNLLRLSADEADEAVLQVARIASRSGIPVWALDNNRKQNGGPDGSH